MTDQLLSGISDKPIALVPSTTISDGNNGFSDGDYQSETETEQPIILELGTTPNRLFSSGSTSYSVINMHLNGCSSGSYLSNAHLTYSTNLEEQKPKIIPSMSSASHLSLYNNPYTQPLGNGSTLPVSGLPSISGGTITSLYSPHIPQTVYSWSGEVGRKATAEIVPPPMYLSYATNHEHIISRETNPSWKEKALQIEKDYKKTACDRERTRMRDMNRAFDLLRSKLPISKPNGKKYSKIESLRIAINYINHLQQLLRDDDSRIGQVNSKTFPREDCVAQLDYRGRYRMQNYKSADKSSSESPNGTWHEMHYEGNDEEEWELK